MLSVSTSANENTINYRQMILERKANVNMQHDMSGGWYS